MNRLYDECCKLLRVPIRVLRNWIDQDRTDARTAAAIVNEMRGLCEACLEGTIEDDEVRWVFGYVEECRMAYRGGAKFGGGGDLESISEAARAEYDRDEQRSEMNGLLELTQRAVRRFATSEQKKRYHSFSKCGAKASASQSRSFDVSRATLHESVEKARHIGLAGVLILAAEDGDGTFDSLVFSESFARTTPYTLRVFAAFESILANHRGGLKRRQRQLTAGFSRLWEHGNRRLHADLSRGDTQTETLAQLIHTSCFVQTLAARWGGSRFVPQFNETWALLSQNGALSCPALRQLYANIGAYCGECDHQLQHLRCWAASRQELSGLLSFVRGVTQPGRPVLTRKFLSHPEKLLERFVESPDANLCSKLADVMVRYLHNPLHHNAGSLRKILAWVETWADLLKHHRLPVDSKRSGKIVRGLNQYRRKLCVTPEHTRAWERSLSNLPRIAG